MREVFNESVKDGDTYEVMYAYMSMSKFERGFVFDWNTTTFFCYIVGFRRSDFSLVLVQTDAALEKHSDPFYVNIDNAGNVSYNPKVHQLCFEYKKGSEDFGELLNIGGTSSKTLYGPKTYISQRKLRDFLTLRKRFA